MSSSGKVAPTVGAKCHFLIMAVSVKLQAEPLHHLATHQHCESPAHIQLIAMPTDVDMGTPQISTLREEETPPPQPTKGKFRVNLLVGEKAASAGPSIAPKKPTVGESEEEEEEQDELEEDQLIDDEDEAIQLKRPLSVTIPAAKPKPRKRPRKSEKVETKLVGVCFLLLDGSAG